MLWSVGKGFRRRGVRWGRLGGRRQRGVRIGSGSGRRSLGVCRVRTRPGRLGCLLRWGRGGSARLVGCHRSLWGRFRGVIYRLGNGKRSPFFMLRVWGCGRSAVVSAVRRRRFLGSCGGTRRPVVEGWFIGPRRRSGTLSGVLAARRFPSWRRTKSCAGMCRIAWVGRSPALMVGWCRDPR